MTLFVLLGLLSVGLLAGLVSGSDDDGGEPPPEASDVFEGTEGDDTVTSDGRPNLLFGDEGDDSLRAGAGADLVFGGAGDDELRGGEDGDILVGGAGDDQLFGWAGNDVMIGGAGNDTLDASSGNDTLSGISGSNVLRGGAGDDFISGLDVPDDWELYAEGSSDFDTLSNAIRTSYGPGVTDDMLATAQQEFNSAAPLPETGTSDLLEGGQGADTLIGDSGDRLVGGADTDLFVINALRDDQDYTDAGFIPVRIGDYQPATATLAAERVEIVAQHADFEPATDVLTLHQVGDDTHVRFGEQTVVIVENRVAANLDAANFRFVAA